MFVASNNDTRESKNKLFYQTAENIMKLKTFWDVWRGEIPSQFPKVKTLELIAAHWNISVVNARRRIKSGRFDIIRDLSFMYATCHIGFSSDRGFFFDREAYERSLEQEEREFAKSLKLSK